MIGIIGGIGSGKSLVADLLAARGAVVIDADEVGHEVLDRPEARLHLYGKELPAPGRKMGHVLLLDDDTERALANAERMIDSLDPTR